MKELEPLHSAEMKTGGNNFMIPQEAIQRIIMWQRCVAKAESRASDTCLLLFPAWLIEAH